MIDIDLQQLEIVLKYLIAGISVVMIVVVLLQVRSGGLGTTFGGSSTSEVYRAKRGFEAVLYNTTIILGAVFAVASLVLAAIGVNFA